MAKEMIRILEMVGCSLCRDDNGIGSLDCMCSKRTDRSERRGERVRLVAVVLRCERPLRGKRLHWYHLALGPAHVRAHITGDSFPASDAPRILSELSTAGYSVQVSTVFQAASMGEVRPGEYDDGNERE